MSKIGAPPSGQSALAIRSGLAAVAILVASIFMFGVGCQSSSTIVDLAAPTAGHPVEEAGTEASPSPEPTRIAPVSESPTATQLPRVAPATVTPVPTATATVTPLPTPTATPIGPCDQRLPGDDLLALITSDYGISRDYVPDDLVMLTDYLPDLVTQGYPTEVRQVILEPLLNMIAAMQAEGLEPLILSGFRSYSAQVIARAKWADLEPDRVGIISAPPGHSEHQLGTTVDFGSPELAAIVGDDEIEFHTYFYQTSEGQWLLENAHRFGFTLSYTREAFEVTGLYYEPWHYRYVGVEMAGLLQARSLTLSEYLLATSPEPCVP